VEGPGPGLRLAGPMDDDFPVSRAPCTLVLSSCERFSIAKHSYRQRIYFLFMRAMISASPLWILAWQAFCSLLGDGIIQQLSRFTQPPGDLLDRPALMVAA
jgi:hypothetical protein